MEFRYDEDMICRYGAGAVTVGHMMLEMECSTGTGLRGESYVVYFARKAFAKKAVVCVFHLR